MKDTYIYVGEKIISDNGHFRIMNIYKTINEKSYTAYIEGVENNSRFLEEADVIFLGEDVFNRLASIRSKTPIETEFGLSDETIEILKNTFMEIKSKNIVDSKARNLIKN